MLLRLLELLAFLGFAASTAYTVFAIVCVIRWCASVSPAATGAGARGDHSDGPGNEPPVTIAKPLCGDEPQLLENLRSFCEQDYPEYQVVFGVRDADDPAAAVARELIHELPGRDLQLIVDGRVTGTNHKVSNLAAMQPAMKHGIIIVSDSDMHVGPDYLRRVVKAFADPGVGAVTCLYRGVPVRANLASVLGAMAINESFLPSALVARTMQRLRYCFGATIGLRRSELDAIGGFSTLTSQLADDYMVGKLVSDRGPEVVLAPYLVENRVFEPSIRELFLHELRWARTIRSMRPASYVGTALTMPLLWSVVFAVATTFSTAGLAAIAVAATVRLALQVAARRSLGSGIPYAPWLVPLRDILSALVFCTAHVGRNVRWKTNKMTVLPGGELSMAATSGRIGRNTK